MSTPFALLPQPKPRAPTPPLVVHSFPKAHQPESPRLAFLSWDLLIDLLPDSKPTVQRWVDHASVPAPVRRRLWMRLTGAERLRTQNKGVYAGLVARLDSCSESVRRAIERDVARTFGCGLDAPEGVCETQSKEAVLRVLCALCSFRAPYALSYCQGLNFVVARFLYELSPRPDAGNKEAQWSWSGTGFDLDMRTIGGRRETLRTDLPSPQPVPYARLAHNGSEGEGEGEGESEGGGKGGGKGEGMQNSVEEGGEEGEEGEEGERGVMGREEDAFWLTVSLVHDHLLGCLHRSDLPFLHDYIQHFMSAFKRHLPALYAHFAEEAFPMSFFAVEWFTCMYSFTHPTQWPAFMDLILIHGLSDFPIAIALALLSATEKKLLLLSFEQLMLQFRTITSRASAHNIVKRAIQLHQELGFREATLGKLVRQIARREVPAPSPSLPSFVNADAHFPARLLDCLKRGNALTLPQCRALLEREMRAVASEVGRDRTKELASEMLFRACYWDATVVAMVLLEGRLAHPLSTLPVAVRRSSPSRQRGPAGAKPGDKGASQPPRPSSEPYILPLHFCALHNAVGVARLLLLFGAESSDRCYVELGNKRAGSLPFAALGEALRSGEAKSGEMTVLDVAKFSGDGVQRGAMVKLLTSKVCLHCARLLEEREGNGREGVAVKVCDGCGHPFCQVATGLDGLDVDCYSVHHCPSRISSQICGFQQHHTLTLSELVHMSDVDSASSVGNNSDEENGEWASVRQPHDAHDAPQACSAPVAVEIPDGANRRARIRRSASVLTPVAISPYMTAMQALPPLSVRRGSMVSVLGNDGLVFGRDSSGSESEGCARQAEASDSEVEAEAEGEAECGSEQGEGSGTPHGPVVAREGNDGRERQEGGGKGKGEGGSSRRLARSPDGIVDELTSIAIGEPSKPKPVAAPSPLLLPAAGAHVPVLGGLGSGLQSQCGLMGGGDGGEWEEDEWVWYCCLCSVPFSLLVRRHHCRRCCRIVCGDCASLTSPLPPRHKSRVRVCDNCVHHMRECACVRGEAGEGVCRHKPWDFCSDNICYCENCNV